MRDPRLNKPCILRSTNMLERVYSDTPKILAIQDVHLTASLETAARLHDFYHGVLGLQPVSQTPESNAISFTGVCPSGPRVIVSLMANPPTPPTRRGLLVQVGNLSLCAEALRETSWPYAWLRGWSYYDRRLATEDPAGHRIEMLVCHML